MAIDEARSDEAGDHEAGNDEAGDHEALDRSAAYDELLRRSLNAPALAEAGPVASRAVDVPTAGVIRLLHEVFRTPRNDAMPSDEPLPERIARFVVHRLLGRGAFGAVYLAHDPILRRQLALKVVHQHLLADEATRRHVLREREIMARLQHPNIVPVWEAGEEDELLYIASEYCPGPTLGEWLADREQQATEFGRAELFSPESLRRSAGWICRLADAVQHSHERGIVHRDLKPGNVLLESPEGSPADATPSNWRPRLTDFGLAKYFHAVQDETRTGLFVGSLEYASPEQVRGQLDVVGPASDIYSLGALLYELLTDAMPHTADSDYDLARKICEEDVVFTAEHRRTLPRDLQAITLRALEREPRDRYASAADLRDDLQRFLSGEYVKARRVSLAERALRSARRNPDVAALSGLCVCFAVLLVGALARNNQQLAVHSMELKRTLIETRTHELTAELERSAAYEMQKRAEKSERLAREVGYLANMRLAYEAWEKNNLTDVRELLERAATQAPSLRGPDWHLLQRELAARYKPFPRMKEAVYGLAFQPSIHSLLTVNDAGKVRRWDLESHLATDEFQGGSGSHALAIAPDETTLAISQRAESEFGSHTLLLWNLEQHQPSKESLHHHATTIESIEFSPDGKWLASGPRYEAVIVSNLENGDSFAIPSGRRNRQVAFSSASDRLAVNTAPSAIDVYELATREALQHIDISPRQVASFVWLRNREVVAVNARYGEGVHLYSVRSGKHVGALATEHIGASLIASADGRWLALGSEEGRLQMFDVSDLVIPDQGAEAATDAPADPPQLADSPASLQILSGFVTDMEFVGQSQIAAADEEGNLVCLDWSAHACRRFRREEAFWTSARWEDNDSLTIFSSERPPERRSLKGAKIRSPSFPVSLPLDSVTSHDGRLQAAFTQAGELAVTARAADTARMLVRSEPGNVSGDDEFVTLGVAIAKSNDRVFATGENNRLTAWNITDGTVLWEETLTNTGRVIAEDPTTGRLFVGGDFETLRVYDSRTGKLLEERSGGNGTPALVIDSAGGRVISVHCDGTLRIQDLALSRPATIYRTHGDELRAVTLSPDGSTILTGGADGIIRVWHADGQPFGAIYRSPLAEAKVCQFLWSPQGDQLAAVISSGAGLSEVVCWPVGPVSSSDSPARSRGEAKH